MATTEDILASLREDLAAHIAAGKSSAERDVRQQIIAHETLTRLRADHDATPSDGLASQIRFWQRKVWQVAEPAAVKPKRRVPAQPEPATESGAEAP